MIRQMRALCLALVLLPCACAAPDEVEAVPSPAPAPAYATEPEPDAPDHRTACDRLLEAPPGDWAPTIDAVLAIGAPAAPILAGLVLQRPEAPGAQAAVAVLGRIGDAATAGPLTNFVTERHALGAEAALALGELRAATAAQALRLAVADRVADPTLRTAAACALVRLGDRSAARPLLLAIVLAGTPHGIDQARLVGLPERSRWALERYMVQRVLLQEAGTCFDLDTDAPWDRLAESARAIDAWLTR